MNYAKYSNRLLAYLIDTFIFVIPSMVALVIGIVLTASDSSQAIGAIIILLAIAGMIIGPIWNYIFRQGSTGQTLGKSKMNISLVDEDSQLPIGAGKCFVRVLVQSLITSASFGVFPIVDYLFPLWDPKSQRLMDKMLGTVVVSTI